MGECGEGSDVTRTRELRMWSRGRGLTGLLPRAGRSQRVGPGRRQSRLVQLVVAAGGDSEFSRIVDD